MIRDAVAVAIDMLAGGACVGFGIWLGTRVGRK